MKFEKLVLLVIVFGIHNTEAKYCLNSVKSRAYNCWLGLLLKYALGVTTSCYRSRLSQKFSKNWKIPDFWWKLPSFLVCCTQITFTLLSRVFIGIPSKCTVGYIFQHPSVLQVKKYDKIVKMMFFALDNQFWGSKNQLYGDVWWWQKCWLQWDHKLIGLLLFFP